MKQRTKILSLLMAIVMVLGVIVALPLTASAAEEFDVRTDLVDYGYASRDLKEISTPVVDGVVDDNDNYTLVVENNANSKQNNSSHNAKEYFAFDGDRYYYAVTLPSSVTVATVVASRFSSFA